SSDVCSSDLVAAERQQDTVAGREEAVLVERATAVPLELDDLAAIERPVELHRETLELRSLVVARGKDAHDVSVDDLDPNAGVGIPARDDRREGGDDGDANEDLHLTWRVVPIVVVRPASSITLKTS